MNIYKCEHGKKTRNNYRVNLYRYEFFSEEEILYFENYIF